MNVKEQLAKRIKETRKLRELTQTKLGKLCGFTNQYIFFVEKGTFSPSVHRVKKIADVLKVDIDYLLGDDDAKNIDQAECANFYKELVKLSVRDRELLHLILKKLKDRYSNSN